MVTGRAGGSGGRIRLMNRQLKRLYRQMRAALVVLLFAPFFVLQTLAQGTMPSSGPDGLTMVLCTGESMVEVVLLEDGSIAPVEDSHAGLGQCGTSLHGV